MKYENYYNIGQHESPAFSLHHKACGRLLQLLERLWATRATSESVAPDLGAIRSNYFLANYFVQYTGATPAPYKRMDIFNFSPKSPRFRMRCIRLIKGDVQFFISHHQRQDQHRLHSAPMRAQLILVPLDSKERVGGCRRAGEAKGRQLPIPRLRRSPLAFVCATGSRVPIQLG